MSPLVIERLDVENVQFQNTFRRLPPSVLKEARAALGLMLLVDILHPPARLHLHSLVNKTAPSRLHPRRKVKVYTIHLTGNDAYKASFTFEDGTAFMRTCGTHDEIDKNP